MIIDWNDQAIKRVVAQAAMRGVFTAIRVVEAEALRLIMNTPKTGRIYRRRGIDHQASAPGEPFASDTGRTVASRTIEDNPAELKSILTFRTAYAEYLEHGTAKMEPRPFAVPAMANTQRELRNIIAQEIKEILR